MNDCLSECLEWLLEQDPSLKRDPVRFLHAAVGQGCTIDHSDIECLADSKHQNIFYQIPWYVSDFIASYFKRIGADNVLGVTRGIGNCFSRTYESLGKDVKCVNVSLVNDDVSALQEYFLSDIHNGDVQTLEEITEEIGSYACLYSEVFLKERSRQNRPIELEVAYHDIDGNEIIIVDQEPYHELLKMLQAMNDDAIAVIAVESAFFNRGGLRSVSLNLHHFGLKLNAGICFDDMTSSLLKREDTKEAYLLFISKGSSENSNSFFTAYLRDMFDEESILDNLFKRHVAKNSIYGLMTGKDGHRFSSFKVEQAKELCRRFIIDTGRDSRWEDAVVAVNVARHARERIHQYDDHDHAVYIPLFNTEKVTTEYHLDVIGKDKGFIQIILNPSFADKQYVCRFLNSHVGNVFLKACSSNGRLSFSSFIRRKQLPLPGIGDQKLMVLKQQALEDLRAGFNHDIDQKSENVWYGE